MKLQSFNSNFVGALNTVLFYNKSKTRRTRVKLQSFNSNFVGALNTVLFYNKSKKIGRFLRGFLVVNFSALGFLDLLKTFRTQRQKPPFLYKPDFHLQSNAFLWFDFQTHGFIYQGRNTS